MHKKTAFRIQNITRQNEVIKKIVLILLGGSEGGLPNYYDVEKLTNLGYPCFILGYFGAVCLYNQDSV